MTEQQDDLEVRHAVLYAVGSICDDEVQKQQLERHTRSRPVPSKDALALLGDLVHKQAEVMATELQHFAHHASRKGVKPEDVLLCARKHPNMTKLLQKYQREHLGAANSASTGANGTSRRRIRRAQLGSDD